MHTDIIYATVDGRRSQPSAEKVPVRVAGRKKGGALKYKIHTAVPGTRIPGARYQSMYHSVPKCEGDLETPKCKVGIVYRSFSKKLCGDGDLPSALPMRHGAARR